MSGRGAGSIMCRNGRPWSMLPRRRWYKVWSELESGRRYAGLDPLPYNNWATHMPRTRRECEWCGGRVSAVGDTGYDVLRGAWRDRGGRGHGVTMKQM